MVNKLQEIFDEYLRMRDSGMDTKAVLQALRSYIESLGKNEREELAAMLRDWEAEQSNNAPPKQRNTQTASVIKPIAPPKVVQHSTLPAAEQTQETAIVWVVCPSCSKSNQQHEVFCYACGAILEQTKGAFETRHFSDPDTTPLSSEHFGADSVLVLRVRGSLETYEVRPQSATHEVIIGRSVEGSAVAPDIDLNPNKAGELGVSRLHLSVQYDAGHKALHVSDLGSANGSFINGQRLLPKEVRVLRHSDELRLGRLVLLVSFRHPNKTIRPLG